MITITQGTPTQLITEVVTPTIFPDRTSQVWKLDLDKFEGKPVTIVWNWEQENELIWVNQLICLLHQNGNAISELYMPYLPYARQDKEITNTSTFAKHTFLEMLLKEHVGNLTALDAHSAHNEVLSYKPNVFIAKAIMQFNADVLVFPDAGAYSRYATDFIETNFLVLDKVRNQLTGKIEGLTFNLRLCSSKVMDAVDTKFRMLIVDDISDYGGTFKYASKFIKENFDAEIGLYVTHFLGHGDIESYAEAGITDIYTTDSLSRYRGNDKGVTIV